MTGLTFGEVGDAEAAGAERAHLGRRDRHQVAHRHLPFTVWGSGSGVRGLKFKPFYQPKVVSR